MFLIKYLLEIDTLGLYRYCIQFSILAFVHVQDLQPGIDTLSFYLLGLGVAIGFAFVHDAWFRLLRNC